MSEWADFRLEVFGEPYLVWHDGADFHEIARRFAEDPEHVLAMLRLGIGENDDVAAQACRHLEPTEEQKPAVTALLRELRGPAYGSTQTEVAASLHALGEGDPAEHAADIVRVLRSPAHWGVRLDAARRLEAFAPTPELVAALAEAVRDEEYLVRFHAASTLRHWAGGEGRIDQDADLFGLITTDSHPDGWARAAERLAAAVRA